MRYLVTALLLALLVAVAGCSSGSGEGDTTTVAEVDFCTAAENFADAEVRALEMEDTADDRRAGALASADAYAALAEAAPEEIRADAEKALEGQRGSFESLDQIGWTEDALADVSDEVTDRLLGDLERFLGDEFFEAEERVVAFVRKECDPTFLES